MLNRWGGGIKRHTRIQIKEDVERRANAIKTEGKPKNVGPEYLTHDHLKLLLELYNLGILIKPKTASGQDDYERIQIKEKPTLPEEMKPPIETDYTQLETEVWYEEKREGQIYHDRARDKWYKDESYMATALGFALCAYSVFYFPQLCMKYGAFTFCIMYLIVTCFFTVPAIYMELIIGQFTQKGPFHCWRLCPIFQGLRLTMIWNTFFMVVANNTRLVWLAFYMCESFRNEFPWQKCSKEWTSVNCKDFEANKADLQLASSSRSPAFEYFRGRVLRLWKSKYADDILTYHPFNPPPPRDYRLNFIPYSDPKKHLNGVEKHSIEDLGVPAVDMIVLLIIINIISFIVVRFRVRNIGFCNFVFLLIGFIFLVLPFTNTWMTPQTSKSLAWFFDLSKGIYYTFSGEAWVAAIQHSFMSAGLGTGAYILFGSHREYTNRRIKSIALAAGFGSWITHCLIGIIMSAYWHRAHAYKNTGRHSETFFGEDVVIEIFPLIMGLGLEHRLSRMYTCIFFAALVLICTVRTFGGIYVIKRTVMDCHREIFDAFRIFYDDTEKGQMHRWERFRLILEDQTACDTLLKIIIVLTSLLTILCLTGGGIFILLFIENYSMRLSNSLVCLLEIVAFTYIWGTRVLDMAVSNMTYIQSTVFYRLAWKFFMPMIIMIYFVNAEFIFHHVQFDGIAIPEYCHQYGLTFGFLPTILSLLVIAVYRTATVPVKGIKDKLTLAIAPEYEWSRLAGGRLVSNRSSWLHYLNFPSGYGLGRRFPKAPEEMYYTCEGFGDKGRKLFIENLTFGFCSTNLFCLKYPKRSNRPLSPGKLMQVLEVVNVRKPSPERLPNKKLMRRQEEARKIALESGNKYLTSYKPEKDEHTNILLKVRAKSDSELNKPEVGKVIASDDRAEGIRMSLKEGEVRKSMENSKDEESKRDSLNKTTDLKDEIDKIENETIVVDKETLKEIPDDMVDLEADKNTADQEGGGQKKGSKELENLAVPAPTEGENTEFEIEKRPEEPEDTNLTIFDTIRKSTEKEARKTNESEGRNHDSEQPQNRESIKSDDGSRKSRKSNENDDQNKRDSVKSERKPTDENQ